MSSKSSNPSPASPCVRQCCLNEQDICLGCGRSLAEILEWGNASVQRREDICLLAQARQRLREHR